MKNNYFQNFFIVLPWLSWHLLLCPTYSPGPLGTWSPLWELLWKYLLIPLSPQGHPVHHQHVLWAGAGGHGHHGGGHQCEEKHGGHWHHLCITHSHLFHSSLHPPHQWMVHSTLSYNPDYRKALCCAAVRVRRSAVHRTASGRGCIVSDSGASAGINMEQ